MTQAVTKETSQSLNPIERLMVHRIGNLAAQLPRELYSSREGLVVDARKSLGHTAIHIEQPFDGVLPGSVFVSDVRISRDCKTNAITELEFDQFMEGTNDSSASTRDTYRLGRKNNDVSLFGVMLTVRSAVKAARHEETKNVRKIRG